eukprot:TRINITY_DN183592_c5_g1_i1.p1 TRINITY_DN183592_c5_g1~~TRINITY_DN183592_c5_g1_i1.p1  ORF type:complete len:492 (-),score=177.56 TRINITY_DN183592_c5_g1_i1:268-1743(-)
MSCNQCGYDLTNGACGLCGWKQGEKAFPSLSPSRKEKLTQIFKEIDEDGNGYVDREEAIQFASYFGLTRSQAEDKVDELFKEVDFDGSGTLELPEWFRYFSATCPKELTEKEFNQFFDGIIEQIRREKRPIKWTDSIKKAFGVLGIVSIFIRCYLLIASIDQWDDWGSLDEFVGYGGDLNSYLRMFSCILGLILSFAGLTLWITPPEKKKKLLTWFGWACMILMVLFLISGAVDFTAINKGSRKCDDYCETACDYIPEADKTRCLATECECGLDIDNGKGPEVQAIILVADADDISGDFYFTFNGAKSGDLPHSSSESDMKSAIENLTLKSGSKFVADYGTVSVDQIALDEPRYGFMWNVTFEEVFYDMDMFDAGKAENLSGTGVSVSVSKINEGHLNSLIKQSDDPTDFPSLRTAVVNFITMVVAATIAFIAIFYSTNCHKMAFLNEWGDRFSSMSGMSKASRKMASSFWFAIEDDKPTKNNNTSVATLV